MSKSLVSLKLGLGCLLQKGLHVYESILKSLGHLCCVSVLTAVEGRNCVVYVGFHGVVAHAITVWDHRAEAHHTVGFSWHLGELKKTGVGRCFYPKQFTLRVYFKSAWEMNPYGRQNFDKKNLT